MLPWIPLRGFYEVPHQLCNSLTVWMAFNVFSTFPGLHFYFLVKTWLVDSVLGLFCEDQCGEVILLSIIICSLLLPFFFCPHFFPLLIYIFNFLGLATAFLSQVLPSHWDNFLLSVFKTYWLFSSGPVSLLTLQELTLPTEVFFCIKPCSWLELQDSVYAFFRDEKKNEVIVI